jgi:hypothetical protein
MARMIRMIRMIRMTTPLTLALLCALCVAGCGRQPAPPQTGSGSSFTPANVAEFEAHRARLAAFQQALLDRGFRVVATTNSESGIDVTLQGTYENLQHVTVGFWTGHTFDRTRPCVNAHIAASLPDAEAERTFKRLDQHLRAIVQGQDRELPGSR